MAYTFSKDIKEEINSVYYRDAITPAVRSYWEFQALQDSLASAGNAGTGSDIDITNRKYTVTADIDVTENTILGASLGDGLRLDNDGHTISFTNGTFTGAKLIAYYDGTNWLGYDMISTGMAYTQLGIGKENPTMVGDKDVTFVDNKKKTHVASEKVNFSFEDLTIFEGNYADARALNSIDIAYVNDNNESFRGISGINASALPDIKGGDLSSIKISGEKSSNSLDDILNIYG